MLGQGTTILTYHSISDVPGPNVPFRGLTVSPENFRSQMQCLSRCGYRGLSLRELHPYIVGTKKGRVVGITIDDGFCNVHDNALHVLQDLGFTATCFFVSGQIGGSNKWDEAIGIPFTPCMSLEQIRSWARPGNEIGAHTIDHVHLTKVAPSEAFRQIEGSRVRLEEIAEQPITSFSYPYGDVSGEVRDLVARSGFTLAVTLVKDQASRRSDPLLLPRRNIRHSDGWIATLRKTILG